jgi:hypothetical protein
MSFVELQLTELQMEEFTCELVGKHSPEIVRLASAIMVEASGI